MGTLPFALQLYTVRDALQEDPAGTLKRVKGIGYDNVECAGYAGLAPAEFKKLLDDAGLTAVSVHAGYEDLTERPGSVVETCNVLGVKYAAVSCGADDKAGWLTVADGLDRAGAQLRGAGIQLCYHNHAHEFVQYDGKYALDILLAAAQPENLACQLDMYWVRDGGEDPVAMVNQYAGRCPLLHIKDMTPDDPANERSHTFAEVGQGVIDWPPIFAAGKAAGARWYIVEQDVCAEDPFKSAEISAQFMKQQ
jgi:sugar phosphate isomerase/epimerase